MCNRLYSALLQGRFVQIMFLTDNRIVPLLVVKIRVIEPEVRVKEPEVRVKEPEVRVIEPEVRVKEREVRVKEPLSGLGSDL